ncbi:ribonuclease HII [Candidatus Wolfebacteria bacterium]|nr:ribonuclease HII [Candidatus Wolfebacteria bacterium]
MKHWQDYICLVGVDEVGRGPLAGPVAVGAFLVRRSHILGVQKLLYGIKDSKRLRERERNNWFARLSSARAAAMVDFRVSFVGPERIDRIGIVRAIQLALDRSLKGLSVQPKNSRILLDGGLTASHKFLFQESIIRGDDSEPVIAAASVVAKVLRDRRMTWYAQQFPVYGFERHKGYATAEHVRLLRQHGVSPLHRKTFVTSFV